MSHEALKNNLRGVAAGLLTPFEEETLDVDHDALAENANALYDAGIRTYLAVANISEYHSLTHEERIASAETAAAALPDDASVLAGAGGSLRSAIALAEAYADVGVDAIMVMPPDHTYKHERGLLEYYRQLGSATDLPLSPYLRGYDPSVGFVASLTNLDSVVGIKYAIDDVPKFAECVAAGADDVVWVDGMAEPHAPALWAEGAEGFSAGVSNFEPRIGLALFDALSAGDWERAREIRNACTPYMNFRGEAGEDNVFSAANSIPAVKKGLDLAGMHGGPVRPPLVGLSQVDERRAEELYSEIAAFET